MLIHVGILLITAKLIRAPFFFVAVGSQANIGGGATALALAETFDRKELMLPAILVGTLGNALGTYLGFLVIQLL